MITVYNKINKSRENTSGFQVVSSVDELERPFLLCLSAQNNYSKTIFGIMREGAQAARLLTTQGVAGKFKLDEFPVDFLGVRFKKDEEYTQSYIEIADKLIYPFLKKNGEDLNSIRKQARKVNILTYCDGAKTYQGIEERLQTLLKRDGFSDEDIHEILSLFGLAALETEIETGSLHATSAAFIDVNDREIYNEKVDAYRSLLQGQDFQSMHAPLGKTNAALYIYEGTGNHNVKEFFKENCMAKPVVASVVSYFLENSLANEHSQRVIPLKLEEVLSQMDYFSNEQVRPEELLEELDEELSYDGAPRYTDSEANLRMELDDIYKTLRKTNDAFIRSLNDKKGLGIRINSVIRGMHEFSSDATFQQVLTYAHMWTPHEGQDILSIPSDKQVRATILDGEDEINHRKVS